MLPSHFLRRPSFELVRGVGATVLKYPARFYPIEPQAKPMIVEQRGTVSQKDRVIYSLQAYDRTAFRRPHGQRAA